MSESGYTIVFTARRFRWLPWPRKTTYMHKRTTWAEAHYMATVLLEGGCTQVSVLPGRWTEESA